MRRRWRRGFLIWWTYSWAGRWTPRCQTTSGAPCIKSLLCKLEAGSWKPEACAPAGDLRALWLCPSLILVLTRREKSLPKLITLATMHSGLLPCASFSCSASTVRPQATIDLQATHIRCLRELPRWLEPPPRRRPPHHRSPGLGPGGAAARATAPGRRRRCRHKWTGGQRGGQVRCRRRCRRRFIAGGGCDSGGPWQGGRRRRRRRQRRCGGRQAVAGAAQLRRGRGKGLWGGHRSPHGWYVPHCICRLGFRP